MRNEWRYLPPLLCLLWRRVAIDRGHEGLLPLCHSPHLKELPRKVFEALSADCRRQVAVYTVLSDVRPSASRLLEWERKGNKMNKCRTIRRERETHCPIKCARWPFQWNDEGLRMQITSHVFAPATHTGNTVQWRRRKKKHSPTSLSEL